MAIMRARKVQEAGLTVNGQPYRNTNIFAPAKATRTMRRVASGELLSAAWLESGADWLAQFYMADKALNRCVVGHAGVLCVGLLEQ